MERGTCCVAAHTYIRIPLSGNYSNLFCWAGSCYALFRRASFLNGTQGFRSSTGGYDGGLGYLFVSAQSSFISRLLPLWSRCNAADAPLGAGCLRRQNGRG